MYKLTAVDMHADASLGKEVEQDIVVDVGVEVGEVVLRKQDRRGERDSQ